MIKRPLMKKFTVLSAVLCFVAGGLACSGCSSPSVPSGAIAVDVEHVENNDNAKGWVLTKKIDKGYTSNSTITSYEYGEGGKEITVTTEKFDSDGYRNGNKTITVGEFDRGNNLTSGYTTEFNLDDELLSEEYLTQEYDNAGNMVLSEVRKEKEGDLVDYAKKESTFDEHNSPLVIAVEQLGSDGEIVEYEINNENEYDQKGNLTHRTQYNERTGETEETLYVYDDKDQLILEERKSNQGDTRIDTICEYLYDEHGQEIYRHNLNYYDDEVQWDSDSKFTNFYNGDRVICRVLDSSPENGYYYAYDEAGRCIQSITVNKGEIVSNAISIYDPNGLLLMTINSSSSGNSWHVVTYDYENLNTGQKVSGTVYHDEKYYGAFTVDYPTVGETIIDIDAVYNYVVLGKERPSKDGPNGETKKGQEEQLESIADYQYVNQAGNYVTFDPAINTDPTIVQLIKEDYEDDQPLHVETDWYEFDLPASWKGKVSYNIINTNTDVYLKGHRSCTIMSVDVMPEEDITEGDIGTAVFCDKKLGYGDDVVMTGKNWIFFASRKCEDAEAYRPQSKNSDQDDAILSILVDMVTGGKVSYADIQKDPDAYRSDPIMFDYLKSTVGKSLKVKKY